MTINRLTATFGRLDNETITFHDGLNVISAPNESGKSTWCALIAAMLYGINTSERARGDRIPGKVRYQPWNGKAMCGTMEVTSQGKNITLMRSTPMSGTPMKDFSATYTGSGEKAERFGASDAGEVLTGLSVGMFSRSAYIAQGDTVITCDAETEKQILAVLSSGEEGMSFTEAKARLSSWQKKRQHDSNGLIAQKNEESEQIRNDLSEIRLIETYLKADLRAFREKKKGLDRLKKEALRTEKEYRQEMQKRISDAYSNAMRERNNCTAAAGKAEKTASVIKRRKAAIASAAGAAAIVLMALFVFVAHNTLFPVLSGILLPVCLVAMIGKSAFSGSLRADAEAERREEKRASAAYDAAQKRIKLLEDALAHGRMPKKYSGKMNGLKNEASDLKKELKSLSSEIAVLRAKLELAGDASRMESRLEQLKRESDELEEECLAIELAEKVLAASDGEIQSSISPLLSKKTTEYMSFLTDGRYDRVLLDRDLSAMAAAAEEVVPHKSGFLSAGTRDLLYISVRLAVCALTLKKDDACPLIIDDAFVNLDEARYSRTIELLEQLSHERQVILFTCRG